MLFSAWLLGFSPTRLSYVICLTSPRALPDASAHLHSSHANIPLVMHIDLRCTFSTRLHIEPSSERGGSTAGSKTCDVLLSLPV